MQRTTYEFVEVSNGHWLPSPIILRQNNRKFARLPGLLLMTTMAGLIVAPQIALAAYAFGSPEVRASLIAHPWATVELAVALCFWVGLVCWPVRSMLSARSAIASSKSAVEKCKLLIRHSFLRRYDERRSQPMRASPWTCDHLFPEFAMRRPWFIPTAGGVSF